MLVRVYERYTSKIDWLHGFYAFSSYSQINLASSLDALSVGWARMEFDAEEGPRLNSTSANNNDWVMPSDPTPATDYFNQHQIPYNLNVYASAADRVSLADGSSTSTVAALTSSAEARAQAVSLLAAAAAGYAGVTLDFEGLKGDTLKTDYVSFLTQLRAALPADKTLYVCVQPDTWYTGFDYRGLGAVCDKVILMAHDYQWTAAETAKHVGTANTDSPVTPFAGVYEALRDLTDPDTGVADRSKIAGHLLRHRGLPDRRKRHPAGGRCVPPRPGRAARPSGPARRRGGVQRALPQSGGHLHHAGRRPLPRVV